MTRDENRNIRLILKDIFDLAGGPADESEARVRLGQIKRVARDQGAYYRTLEITE